MVRLLTIKAAIAALKRAIAISRKLKPRTWTYLAITQAVLAALCFWGYRQFPKYEVGPAKQVVIQTDALVFEHITLKGFSMEEDALIREALLPKFTGRCTQAFNQTGLRSPCQVVWESGVMLRSSIDLYVYHLEFSTGRAQAGVVPLRQFPRFESPIILQVAGAEGKSLLDTVVKMMLLFQAIIFTIGSATSSVFLYFNYRRGQLDLKLKALQLREMQLRIEQMERDRMRAVDEAARSSIVLLS
jgi:hypothetical protein